MGIELAQRSESYTGEDRRWLATLHGQDTNRGVTLDGDLFPAGTFGDGIVRSGTDIGIVTATGLAGPYAAGQTDGRQTAVGHLLNTEVVGAGRQVSTAVVTHGVVNRDYLPANSGHDAAAEADLPNIRYQDR